MKLKPVALIVLSFVVTILIGTLLLCLPISLQNGVKLSFVDSLFMSTSAICVTGLTSVRDVSMTFSPFGKVILGILIQIGGLGCITVATILFLMLGAKLNITDRYLLKEALNQDKVAHILKLLRSIIVITFTIELVGAIVNFFVFKDYFDVGTAIGVSVFHSLSAFNNAGFDILGDSSLINYSNNILLNINTMVLIVLGGLGFIVIIDILKNKFNLRRLRLHTKLVLMITIVLIVVGMLFIKLSNYSDVSWLQALFLSVTSRTAGFATVSMTSINSAALLFTIFLMIVGASPASTGGGIKTTTLYTLVRSMTSFARGKPTIVGNRKISEESKMKAFVLFFFAISFISMACIIILLIEVNNPEASLRTVLFETVSAFATVGLSLGITVNLSMASKIILCVLMFCGRLGPITIMSIWNESWNKPTVNNIDYLEEKMMIG